ncbi:3-oxoacyl-ACP synthase [Sporocytophaga myxococcoides]|uniref:3-oxoacyl-[acyl-carrier-protein] synthase 1 n=1 Tax=Sporocytophaga myxococcoides TaxID=153721 RepID=A0A098LJ57_9BACT|nr:beta-ketoacyl-[acyl-carrier-protein] synthase family protein [Sporocytophaga myxococcoides]GAL87021.1 3-oxoacyl-ACP synthase [Sporocytophaga myxococcoides]
MNRVVITGIGIYSCLGTSLDQVRDSLFQGKSGIVFDEERKIMGFRSPLTGMVEKPVLKGILDRRQRIGLAEQGEYAYLSTLEAIKNAKLDEEIIDRNEFGVLFGNDSSARAVIEATDIIREKKDTTLVGSGSVFQSMNSTVTMNLATIFKLKGVNFTVSGACASGSHAIGIGYFLIKHGLQKGVICGGAQEINPFSMGNFDALSTFSVRVDEPTRASRPFDKNRDGLVPSGGAATVIIESYESAVERGAPILAEIIGYGFSSNGGHISQPNVEGPVRALEMSLRDAGIPASLIDYVNAHATSTPVGDMYEARALDSVFGGSKPLVSSTKSMTGHECWMAGASEIVYSLLMMQNDFVAPNINLETPDEDSAKLNIATKTVEKNIDTLLSNSFGFGGTNSSLILKKVK